LSVRAKTGFRNHDPISSSALPPLYGDDRNPCASVFLPLERSPILVGSGRGGLIRNGSATDIIFHEAPASYTDIFQRLKPADIPGSGYFLMTCVRLKTGM